MNKPSQHGFTLIELMIAMIAGAFAVAGVYYLNGVSSRSFAEQMRVSETQMSLRSAMEQLRRDFSRAGYLGTPNSKLIYDCSGTQSATGTGDIAPRALQALQVVRDGSTNGTSTTTGTAVSTLLAPATNKTRADTVDVWGNYATPEVYLVDPVNSTANKIVLQVSSEGFRRSFYEPVAANAAATYTAASKTRFEQTFKTGRMVRIENGGRFFFRDILTVDGTLTAPTITLASSLPDACFVSSDWTSVAPVVHLRYAVEPDSADELSRLQSAASAAGTAPPGARRAMLVRREIDTANNVVANSSRMVLDYAVEFGVDAFVNTATLNTDLPVWTFTRAATDTSSAPNTTPDRYRSLLVTLTARSVEVDPKLATVARATFDSAASGVLDSPLMTFRVIDPNNAALVLNARTRTMRSEIFLLNL